MVKFMKNLPDDCVYSTVKTPVGVLALIANDEGLRAVLWEKDRRDGNYAKKLKCLKQSEVHPIIRSTKKQLSQYFSGQRKTFDVPVVLDGTPFQKMAWSQLRKIPYGKTISYAEQAEKIGDAKKARAVGTANSKNPISIIVPCHRVIAKSGALAGFGGGLQNKKILLDLERR